MACRRQEAAQALRRDRSGGGVGERVSVMFGKKKIIMERVRFEEKRKSFSLELSTNKSVTIKESVTTWRLYDASKRLLGELVFDRRLTNQDDFVYSPKRTVLISFNDSIGYMISPVRLSTSGKEVIS